MDNTCAVAEYMVENEDFPEKIIFLMDSMVDLTFVVPKIVDSVGTCSEMSGLTVELK